MKKRFSSLFKNVIALDRRFTLLSLALFKLIDRRLFIVEFFRGLRGDRSVLTRSLGVLLQEIVLLVSARVLILVSRLDCVPGGLVRRLWRRRLTIRLANTSLAFIVGYARLLRGT